MSDDAPSRLHHPDPDPELAVATGQDAAVEAPPPPPPAHDPGGSECRFCEMTRQHQPQCARRLPKRIILVRHGESQGNLDMSAYTTTPDYRIPLTALGVEQARARAGEGADNKGFEAALTAVEMIRVLGEISGR